jgi:serine/threonine protein kinase
MLAGLAADESDHSDRGNAYAVTTPQPGGFVPPVPQSLAAHFPQLEILEVLGHGGMGAVYKARQSKLDRIVALKIIRPESADDPTFAERFNREARTLARLSHPNIVAVHDFGEVTLSEADASGKPRPLYYFLMEYVDGANLRQLMEAGAVKPDQALAIIPQICEALQFAHDEGIVHRDIKPENVLIDTRGRVKIADFGLAKLAARTPGDFTLTATHQVMGTPRYMAPEQMTGSHHVDHRADIYSLGVVFYELLTGEVPMGQFDPPSKRAPIDARLDGIVLRALAREPERRFQRASELKSSVEVISSASIAQPVVTRTHLPPRGASTIIEREIAAAWHWVAGSPASTQDSQPRFPTLLAILLAIAGTLMFLLPWMEVTIPELEATGASHVAAALPVEGQVAVTTRHASFTIPASEGTRRIERASHVEATPTETALLLQAQAGSPTSDAWPSDYARSLGLPGTIQIQPGETITLQGRHVWPGLVASSLFSGIALLVWMLPSSLWSRGIWNLLIVILAGAAIACTLVFPMEVENIVVSRPVPAEPAPVYAPEAAPIDTTAVSGEEQTRLIQAAADAAEESAGDSSNGDQLLSRISHRISYREGFYGSLALSVSLLLLGGTGIRRSLANGLQEPVAATQVAPPRLSPKLPGLTMLALGITGALLTLAPWFEVQITDPAVLIGMDGTQLEIVNGRTAHIVEFSGLELICGKCAAVLLACTGLSQVIVPRRGRSSFILAILVALMALAAVALVFVAREELRTSTVYIVMNDVDADGAGGADIGTGWQWISHLQHRVDVIPYYYACLGAAVVLLVLAAAGLREALSSDNDGPREPARPGSPIARIRFAAPVQEHLSQQVLAHFESHGYRVQEQSADRWVFHRGSGRAAAECWDIQDYDTTLTVRATISTPGQTAISCLWEVRTLGEWVTKKDIGILEAEGRELELILTSNSPGGPPTVLGVSIATRALTTGAGPESAPLSTPESVANHSSTTGTAPDLDEVLAEVDGPSLAMIVVGLLVVVGHLIGFGILITNPGEDELAWITIGVMITGTGMINGGINLRCLWSRGWAQMGIIAGFIPASPGWIIGVFISIWAQRVLNRPHVVNGFLQRKRQRATAGERVTPPDGTIDLDAVRAEVDGPSLAMLSLGLVIAIAHVVALILVAGMPAIDGREAINGMGYLGIATGLGMFIGGLNLRWLRSRGGAQLGIISGMIPSGPGFVLALPISLWSLAVFNRPHMPQAFLQQRRARRAAFDGAPRFSRKAIFAAVWAGLFLLIAVPGVMLNFVAFPSTEPPPPGGADVGLILTLLVPALPILLAPIGTTILGCMAIGDIRHSMGRLYGMGLAVADALLFPLLLLNGGIFAAFMYFNLEALHMDLPLALFTAISGTVAIGGGASSAIVKSVWEHKDRPGEHPPQA